MADKSETVTVRLPTPFARLVRETAEKNGQTVSDFLRPIIIGALEDSSEHENAQLTELRQVIQRMSDEIRVTLRKLRGDQKTSLAGLLRYLSAAVPEEDRMNTDQILKWIEERFPP